MVDLSDRQTQVRILVVIAAALILMFFLGVPPFDGGNMNSPMENETNTTNETPPTEPVEGFPVGASEQGIAAETLLQTHRETLRNASSLTYYYQYSTNSEGAERTYRQTKAQLNKTLEVYTVQTQTTDAGTYQYRTPSESFEKPILSDEVKQISPTPAVPSTQGTDETNGFGASAFEERLTRENATFEYQGKTTFLGEEVHAYKASESVIVESDNFTFSGEPSMTVYVHPKGYIMGFDSAYRGLPPSRPNTEPDIQYKYTEVVYNVNTTIPSRPEWVPE